MKGARPFRFGSPFSGGHGNTVATILTHAAPGITKRYRARKDANGTSVPARRPVRPAVPVTLVGALSGTAVKSKAGRRGIAVPDELFSLLMAHRQLQDCEREHAGTEWHEGDWIFAQPNGKPIDPRRDQYEWKALLADAGVREARLHDARHTAATVLLLLGVQPRAVMDVMGWSNIAMLQRYTHVTARLRREIADQLNRFLWEGK